MLNQNRRLTHIIANIFECSYIYPVSLNMDFLSFDLKQFKNAFYTALSINAFLTLAAYLSGANVSGIIFLAEDSLQQTRMLLLLLIAAIIFQTSHQKKLLRQLDALPDFKEKVAHYFKIYKRR